MRATFITDVDLANYPQPNNYEWVPSRTRTNHPGRMIVGQYEAFERHMGFFVAPTGKLSYTLHQALLGLKESVMKRRGAQRGSLDTRGKSWVVRYRRHVVGADGVVIYEPTTKTVGVAVGPDRMSKSDAQIEADRIVAAANAIAAVPQMQATLRQFVDTRFRAEHIQGLRKAGQDHYEYLLRVHILPHLGETQLLDITPGKVQILLSSKVTAELSKQTVIHIRNVISAVFGHLKMLGYWRNDLPFPTEGVKCFGKEAEDARSLSAEQVRSLITEIDQQYKPLVALLAAAGLRIGEALGLKWKYANMTDRYVVIDGQEIPPYSIAVVQVYSRGRWGRPKTKRSRRIVPLSSTAWVSLTEMRERDTAACGDDPVFRSRTGKPFDAHNVAKRFLKPAGVKMGCPWVHWHAFRHTAVSLSELDIVERQKVLGHTTAAMSVHYSHPDLEKARAGLERVN